MSASFMSSPIVAQIIRMRNNLGLIYETPYTYLITPSLKSVSALLMLRHLGQGFITLR